MSEYILTSRIYVAILFLIASFNSHSQNNMDSLISVFDNQSLPISDRIAAGSVFAGDYVFYEPDSSKHVCEKILELANNDPANSLIIASAYSTLGIAAYMEANYPASLENYLTSLNIQKLRKDSINMAKQNQLIAITYYAIQDWDKCLEYNQYSLDYFHKINSHVDEGRILNNIGLVYLEMGDWEQAKSYFLESYALAKDFANEITLADYSHNLAIVYDKAGDADSARHLYNEAYLIRKELNYSYGLISSCFEYGMFLTMRGELNEGIALCHQGLDLATQLDFGTERQNCFQCLAKGYELKGNSVKALFYLNKYIALKDSLAIDDAKSKIVEREALFKYEQQKFEDSLKHVKDYEVKDLAFERDIEKERSAKYFLYFGAGILLLLALFVLQRMIVVRRKNALIEHQKSLVEEKNQEIMDSLGYAKRIQKAIIPSAEIMRRNLPDSFVLYLPKDIVSGDFYWLETTENIVLFAAADCTGHGVPGAMVSVVCNNALNRSVKEFGLTDPGVILDKTKELVIDQFEKSEEEVKDGMDISLCALRDNQLQWAGANNPLWIVRKENGAYKIIEFKPDKQPIGKFSKGANFTSHQIYLEKGDSIYIFTDGFQDQFGGEKGKKFKAASLRQVLLENAGLSMEKQKELLRSTFFTWKGGLEQVDDVCLIGVKIE